MNPHSNVPRSDRLRINILRLQHQARALHRALQGGIAAGALLAALPSSAAAGSPPNVLLILADDLRPLLGCYGDALAQTPNIDRLAQRGVRFDRAYCSYPICGPSRASFLSGRRPQSSGYYGWESVPGVTQLPAWFKQHGYRTAEFGKVYHTNRLSAPKVGERTQNVVGITLNPPGCWDVSDPCVTAEDVDGYGYAYSATLRDENPALARFIAARGDVSPPQFPGAWQWMEWVELKMPDAQTSDGVLVRRAATTIAQTVTDGKPFFVAAGLRRPHQTLAAPQSYFDRYRDVDLPGLPREPHEHLKNIPDFALTYPVKFAYQLMSDDDRRGLERAYRANVAYVDAQIGELLRTLDEHDLWKNTVVILTTDHGWHLGEHGGLVNKHTLFEEATRVPFIVVAPGIAGNGAGCGYPVELVDLFPTLTDLCGLPAPAGLDGLSLRPLLADAGSRLPREGAVSVVRRVVGQPGMGAAGTATASRRQILGVSLRTTDWRYTEWDGGKAGIELYDETTDPHEMKNLAHDPAFENQRKALQQLLTKTVERKEG